MSFVSKFFDKYNQICSLYDSIYKKLVYFSEDPLNNETLDSKERASQIFQKALSCKAISDYYSLANKSVKGKISIKFHKYPPCGFDAAYDSKCQTIRLANHLSDDEALSCFVFELTNAVNEQKHNKIYCDLLRLKISPETFAKESERVEFEGSIKHCELIKSAISEKGWSESLHRFNNGEKIEDFDEYWNSTLKFSAHANYWRKSGTYARNLHIARHICCATTAAAIAFTIFNLNAKPA